MMQSFQLKVLLIHHSYIREYSLRRGSLPWKEQSLQEIVFLIVNIFLKNSDVPHSKNMNKQNLIQYAYVTT